ncbi:hypothetical protein DL93DRAFT_2076655 [Clavulina sp. PMI_390]|nr:hypothetical protein DL93DRAFT_2076655 [Clavulina sp. PMI_390]
MTPSEKQHHNFQSSPFCRLPDEILISIFEIDYYSSSSPLTSTLSRHDDDRQYEYGFTEADSHVRKMSQVCTRWRSAALASGTLWSSVHVQIQTFPSDDPYASASAMNALKLRLARSGNAPLHMHISAPLPLLCSSKPVVDTSAALLITIALSQIGRVRSLTIDAFDIEPFFPLIGAQQLKSLTVRARAGDLDELVLFGGIINDISDNVALPLEELSIELPILSRTHLNLSASPTKSGLRALRVVCLGNEAGILAIIAASRNSLETIEWRESVPCLPSPLTLGSGMDPTENHGQLGLLPRLENLLLDGCLPLPPFTPSSHHTNAMGNMPRLQALMLYPRGTQRSRRYVFTSPSPSTSSLSSSPPSTALHFDQPTEGTIISASPVEELNAFLHRAHLPSLKKFVLGGSAAGMLASLSTPSTTPLEEFLTRHVGSLQRAQDDMDVHIPIVIMPSFAEALFAVPSPNHVIPNDSTPTATNLTIPPASPLRLTFSFRNSYMPDESQIIPYLRSLSSHHSDGPLNSIRSIPIQLTLVRDAGIWEHAYKMLNRNSMQPRQAGNERGAEVQLAVQPE